MPYYATVSYTRVQTHSMQDCKRCLTTDCKDTGGVLQTARSKTPATTYWSVPIRKYLSMQGCQTLTTTDCKHMWCTADCRFEGAINHILQHQDWKVTELTRSTRTACKVANVLVTDCTNTSGALQTARSKTQSSA